MSGADSVDRHNDITASPPSPDMCSGEFDLVEVPNAARASSGVDPGDSNRCDWWDLFLMLIKITANFFA